MLTLRDSLNSSSARPLRVRRRRDLVARRHHYQGRSYWIVKEPLGLRYFRFHEEEYSLLMMLDGRTSLDELKSRFETQFRPQKITLEELQQFIGMLHRSGLVTADAPGQDVQLLKRRRKQKRRQLLAKAANLLSIRFRGFDPERLLNAIYPKVRWFFSVWTVAICLCLGLAALMLVTVEFHEFRSRLPGFHDFFNFRNAFWLAITLGVTKVLHEFGHGLSCKHFGGECHEMGVMLLVLTPCLYCDVSDSWLLPSKWRRAAIGAAGMYVELVLASLATFIWWFTEPGLLHYTCLNIMFVCSVSTILFNINPLLRYDGYYILSDLFEIPNLRQKADQLLHRKLGQWLLGIEPSEDPFLPQQRPWLFAAYSVAAAVYRWFVLAAILWFLYQFFKPMGLESIGATFALVSLASLVGMPLYKLGRFFYIPGRIEQVKKPRMYASLAVLTAVAAACFLIPLPQSVLCPLEIQPRDAQPVYVAVSDGGRLAEMLVRPGERVQKGQPLARLENLALEDELLRLEGLCAQFRRKLAALRLERHRNPAAGGEIPQVEEALASLERQLAQRQEEHRRLIPTAPCDGFILPPPERSAPPAGETDARSWSGSPFDVVNLGAHLDEGTLLGYVGDPRSFTAMILLDQTQVELARAVAQQRGGPVVDIKLEHLPGRTWRSEIDTIGTSEIKSCPGRLSAKAGGPIVTTTDAATGTEKPRTPLFPAGAPLDDPAGEIRLGLRGEARVYLSWEPLGYRMLRWLYHTFRFEL